YTAVLLDVVQERGGDGCPIELEPGDGHCRVERVDDVGVARQAALIAVRFGRKGERLLDERDGGRRQVAGYAVDQRLDARRLGRRRPLPGGRIHHPEYIAKAAGRFRQPPNRCYSARTDANRRRRSAAPKVRRAA